MSAVEMTAVLIVADHQLATEAIRRELRDASGCSVVGCVDGPSCTAAIEATQPNVVVIVDSIVPALTLARIGEAADAPADAKVVLLTDRMEADRLAKASAAGVDAAIGRTLQPGSLATFVREVARGNAFHTFDSLPHRESRRERRPVAEALALVHLSTVRRDPGVAHLMEATRRAHVNRFPGTGTVARRAAKAA